MTMLKSKNNSLSIQQLNTDAFSNLRTNIQFSTSTKSIKSIVVTSSNSKEGKSTVACNLAISFSQSGKKVILLDCNFRNPSIHKQFKLSNTVGLSDILSSKYKVEDCLLSCDVKNLYILTCGNTLQNPAELLSSKEMLQFVCELKENFDLVIIDAPPMLCFADSQILSAITDGTIIVSKYGKTDKGSIVKCKEIVNNVGGRIIGSIINQAPKKFSSLYYKNYYKPNLVK